MSAMTKKRRSDVKGRVRLWLQGKLNISNISCTAMSDYPIESLDLGLSVAPNPSSMLAKPFSLVRLFPIFPIFSRILTTLYLSL